LSVATALPKRESDSLLLEKTVASSEPRNDLDGTLAVEPTTLAFDWPWEVDELAVVEVEVVPEPPEIENCPNMMSACRSHWYL
jgi:hypothetical protein